MASGPKLISLHSRIREDLLYRLRWNILATLDDIEIRTGPDLPTTDAPLFGHHLAHESIANPPLSRIDEVCIGELLNRVDLRYEEEDRYKPPPALTIDNADGSPITLGQFVREAHAYLNLHMEELNRAKAELYGRVSGVNEYGGVTRTIGEEPYLPPNIALFFSHAYAIQIGQIVRFSTKVIVEGQYLTADEFWAGRLKIAKKCEQSRENP